MYLTKDLTFFPNKFPFRANPTNINDFIFSDMGEQSPEEGLAPFVAHELPAQESGEAGLLAKTTTTTTANAAKTTPTPGQISSVRRHGRL